MGFPLVTLSPSITSVCLSAFILSSFRRRPEAGFSAVPWVIFREHKSVAKFSGELEEKQPHLTLSFFLFLGQHGGL